MNLEQDRLSADVAEIASKVIEGEAILINLKDGTYYSLDGAGCSIWQAVVAASTLDEIVSAVTRSFDVSAEAARHDALALLGRLAEEKMLLVSERTSQREAIGEPTAGDGVAAYTTPRLQAYHDMAELLALDPPTPGVLDNLMRQRLDPEGD